MYKGDLLMNFSESGHVHLYNSLKIEYKTSHIIIMVKIFTDEEYKNIAQIKFINILKIMIKFLNTIKMMK
jgi:hypothetical protein